MVSCRVRVKGRQNGVASDATRFFDTIDYTDRIIDTAVAKNMSASTDFWTDGSVNLTHYRFLSSNLARNLSLDNFKFTRRAFPYDKLFNLVSSCSPMIM